MSVAVKPKQRREMASPPSESVQRHKQSAPATGGWRLVTRIQKVAVLHRFVDRFVRIDNVDRKPVAEDSWVIIANNSWFALTKGHLPSGTKDTGVYTNHDQGQGQTKDTKQEVNLRRLGWPFKIKPSKRSMFTISTGYVNEGTQGTEDMVRMILDAPLNKHFAMGTEFGFDFVPEAKSSLMQTNLRFKLFNAGDTFKFHGGIAFGILFVTSDSNFSTAFGAYSLFAQFDFLKLLDVDVGVYYELTPPQELKFEGTNGTYEVETDAFALIGDFTEPTLIG